MTVLGAISLPGNPPVTLPALARAADDAGLEELWFWEDCFLNGGVSAVTAALAVTERLRVGVGIMPAPFRNVALSAMEIATMARVSGGRVIPGIGPGVQEWMAQVGVRPRSPLTQLREYATALRALLAGETVTTDGQYVHLDAVRLDWAPEQAPPVVIAATGPKMLALAGAVGDGTVISGGTPPSGVTAAVEKIAATGPHEVIVFVPAVSGPRAAARLVAAGEQWPTDWPGLAGTPEDIAAGVREFAAAGATRVILQPLSDEPDPQAYVRFVAQEIRPLVD